MTEIKIGDKVRSYDFPDRKHNDGDYACFCDGEVVEIRKVEGCYRYVIKVSRSVFAGKVRPNDGIDTVMPPVNGVPIFGSDRVTNGVVKLENDDG